MKSSSAGRGGAADSATDRFLDAYASIERVLRRSVGDGTADSFASLVGRAAKHNSIVRRFQTDLRELGDLRNAIVHERSDGHPIAEPFRSTVDLIEKIARLVDDPPLALSIVGQMSVQTCSPTATVAEAAMQMRAGDFSQLPVVEERRTIGLLTAETITRWLASQLSADGGVILAEHTVEEVLPHTESPDGQWTIVPRTASVFEVLDLFEHSFTAGQELDAVLFTDRGTADQAILALAAVYDVPRLYRAITS